MNTTLALQYLEKVIKPVLDMMDLNTAASQALLLGTIAQESGGQYIAQIGGGPALGVYQIEPATHDDILENVVDPHPRWDTEYENLMTGVRDTHMNLLNPLYATFIARLCYWRHPEPLPQTLPGLAAYYKKYYNTPLGAATEEDWLENFPAAVME